MHYLHLMMDARWHVLKQVLLESGWVWREDTLYAPHETMWFQTSSDQPNFAQLRNAMTEACEATSNAAQNDIDEMALHEDLVSLVAALDVILDGN